MKGWAKIWGVAGVVTAGLVVAWCLRPPVHQHCIKAASGYFFDYASENEGRFPSSEKGWGDALLKLGPRTGDSGWVRYVVGVGDDGAHLIEALKTETDVDEGQCTRIYVQGLKQSSSPGIAILFDRNSVKGGDHFRGMPGQKSLREVITVDGAHKFIPDTEWAGFVNRQRELLREEGFGEEQIAEIYGPGR